jgi:hypothetical protein
MFFRAFSSAFSFIFLASRFGWHLGRWADSGPACSFRLQQTPHRRCLLRGFLRHHLPLTHLWSSHVFDTVLESAKFVFPRRRDSEPHENETGVAAQMD